MKYLSFSIFIVIVFINCSKNDNDVQIPTTQTPALLQNKIWFLDSVHTITSNYTSFNYPAANEEQTVVFGSDTLVENTGSFHVTYNTSYDGISKLYFWIPGTTQTIDMYRQIDSISNAFLIISQFPQPDKRIKSYYHIR